MRTKRVLLSAAFGLILIPSLTACREPNTSQSRLSEGDTPTIPVEGIPAPSPQTPVSEVAPQIVRFTGWLDIIEKDLVGTPQEVADLLVARKSRAIAFNLQALGRLYKDEDELFNTLHKKFRKLEDAIGDYQKWRDLVAEGTSKGASEIVMAKLTTNRDRTKIDLEKTLVSTNFLPINAVTPSYIQELRIALQAYAWKDVATDREIMRQKLIDELEHIKTSTYDFSHLEEGNGVHEFRRKMRWFSMEARSLSGMVTLKPKTSPCPVPAYAYLVNDPIATTKYAVLPGSPSEPNPITLTPCLYVKVARLIEEVNWIKAKVELQDSLSEETPTDLVDPADQLKLENMLKEAMTDNLFGRLQEELAAG